MLKTSQLWSVLSLTLLVACCNVLAGRAAEEDASPDLDNDEHQCGRWTFDESTGRTAKDASTHRRDAALPDGVSFDDVSVAGRIGKAIKLSGKGVVVTDYKGVLGKAPRTICVWIRSATPRGEFVSWGTDDIGKKWSFGFVRGHVGVNPHGGYYHMEARPNDNEWHHVAVVVAEAQQANLHDDVTLYLDGEIAELDPIGLLDLWPIDTMAKQDVTIGKGFQGQLDDLRIYDRPLSEDEIKAVFEMAE